MPHRRSDTHVHLAFDAGTDPVGALAERDDGAVLAAMAEAAAARVRAGLITVRDLGDRRGATVVIIDEAHRHGLPVTGTRTASMRSSTPWRPGWTAGSTARVTSPPTAITVPDDLVAAIVDRRIVVGATVGLDPTAADARRRRTSVRFCARWPCSPAISGSGPGVCRMAGVETISSREVYANAWMTVREDAIRRADGSDGTYGVVDKPTAAVIIPRDGDRVHLVEQFRYPVAARRWEFPMGTAPDRAELDPTELAARELEEETGLVAGRMELLGDLDIAPGMSSQREHVFLATELTQRPSRREHTEQDMQSRWFTTAEFERMVRCSELVDAQSLAAYLLLLLHDRKD